MRTSYQVHLRPVGTESCDTVTNGDAIRPWYREWLVTSRLLLVICQCLNSKLGARQQIPGLKLQHANTTQQCSAVHKESILSVADSKEGHGVPPLFTGCILKQVKILHQNAWFLH